MENLGGRDIGRIKKEGVFSGTQANRSRIFFSVGIAFAGALMGGLQYLLGGNGYLTSRLKSLDKEMEVRNKRAQSIVEKRKLQQDAKDDMV